MLTPGAEKAKSSVKSLSTTLTKAKGDLAGYQSQLKLAKDIGDIEGYRKYSGLVNQGKQSVFGLTQQLEGAKSSLASSAKNATQMAAAFGPIAVAAAVAVAGIAALVVTAKEFVIKSLDVVNASQLMTAQFEALGGAGSGKKTTAMLGELSEKLPQTKTQLAEWTRQIEKMGVTDLGKIRSELIATASAQAILGEGGDQAYEKITRKIHDAIDANHTLKISSKELTRTIGTNLAGAAAAKMGMTLEQLETKLKAGLDPKKAHEFGEALKSTFIEKGKGPLDVMMNSLETMGKKAQAAWNRLFSGVDTKPLTEGLRNIIALFDSGAPSADGMKAGFTGAMNAIIRLLGSALESGEYWFLTIELAAIKTYTAVKPLIKAIETISGAMSTVGKAHDSLAGGAADKLGLSKEDTKTAGNELFSVFMGALTGGQYQFADMFGRIIGSLGDAKAQEIAYAQGKNIGKSAESGIKDSLGVHSPSTAAIKIGMNVGEGLGMGMENSPAPDRAARTISSNALGGLAGGKSPFGGGSANDNGAGGTSNVFHIAITAPEGVTDAHQLSVIGLSTALERYQIGSGR